MASADRLIEIFHEAKARSAGPDRDGFLGEVCREDAELKTQVLSLLQAHDDAGRFMRARPALPPEIEANFAGIMPEKAGEHIGRYKLLQEIGEGGFGTVWMAEQIEPVSRRVALKIIKLGMDTTEFIARFEAERQALAMMDHPNIAKVLDAGATNRGRPFFVMELVKGMPITQYCDQVQLGTHERLALFGDVCSAINHAHQKGVIHRDIKPSNVMITLHGDKPVVKVIDFGIAKATQGRLTDKTLFTRFEQMVGTPVYMSPEQAATSGLDIDTRSDIYALGILLYELLTGKPPFDAKSLASAGYEEMRRIIREVEPPKPSSRVGTMAGEERTLLAKSHRMELEKLNRLVEPDLDWIVMKAIDKDRTRRYETANNLALDIKHFLADEPVSATPPSPTYLLRKFARRNKTALRLAAGMAAVLVLATVVSTWQAVRATRAERRIAETLAQVAAERDAKELARKNAEDISQFLGDVFQSFDPAHEGHAINVKQTLAAAAKRVDTDFRAQPAQRAKLQATLCKTCNALGFYLQAIPPGEKAREYYLATSGPEHPDTLSAMHNLAHSYRGVRRHDEALKLLVEGLATSRRVNGPEHPETLHYMNCLAVSYSFAARGREALELREEVLTLDRKVFGPEHRQTLMAMNNLAASYSKAGRRDEALKLREEVLPLRRKTLGPEHPDTLASMNGLANSYDVAGRRKEALKLREKALALYRKVLGPEHPETLFAMSDLANSYARARRHDEAVKMREEVLALRRKVLGREHPDTLSAMTNLTYSYDAAGRRNEALKMREEVLALDRKVLGPEHPDTLMAMNNLAVSYSKAGRRDEALKLREEVLPLRRKILGPEHPDTLTAMYNLAVSYTQVGRAADAISLLANASALRPSDTYVALKIAVMQAWFGKDTDYAATSGRMLKWAQDATNSEDLERVAKFTSLRPEADASQREAALALARRAVALGQEHQLLPLFKMALGMAEYRSGHYPVANEELIKAANTAAETGDYRPYVEGTAAYYRAMSLFKQDRQVEARNLFTATEAKTKPLPADEKNPLADGTSDHDDLILWLAYKEAKALLAESSTPEK